MDFERIAEEKRDDEVDSPLLVHSEVSRVIAAQEAERKRISRELHDGIAQELLGVSFVLKRLEPHLGDDAEARQLFAEANNDIDRILDELHNISVELRPSALDHLGFIPALRSQAAVFEKTYGAEIGFEGNLSRKRFDPALETQAYRICQEAVLNACKYSGADKVHVTLEDADGWLHATVVDHGCGFDVEHPEVVRVVLADDHEVVRAGFKMILEQDAEIKVVAEAADGTQAYTIVSRERPDILLMDISMPPGQSGLVACEKIARDFPGTRIVILTMFAEPEYLFYTLRGGAAGYVLKNSTSEELLSAVHAVAGGGSYIHPKMAALLTKQLVGAGEEEDRSYQQLSNRELEILQLLAKGYTNKEISEQVYLSVKTVEAHRSKIYKKLGFKTRADLVSYALEHKLLDV